jgi:signal transduction histidine kinase
VTDAEASQLVQALAALGRGELDARLPPDGPEAFAAFNEAAARITGHVRAVTRVTLAVAAGDLPPDLDVPAGGEIAALHRTINAMLANLRRFADEVSRVGREVGAQAAPPPRIEGVSGVWKELTLNLSAAEQAALVARYKSDLLANMSHELRTPLNSLLVLAKILSDNRERNLTAKQVEYARTIHGSGGDLLSLINDFLDLAKMDAGTMRVDLVELDLDDLTWALGQMFAPLAADKGLRYAVEVDPGAPARLRTDPRRLQQILRNLVGNAIKFTDRGGVVIRVSGAGPGRIAFAVVDTGVGIPAAELGLVFEPFQQASTGKVGGTGLGLTISRALASLLGGTLDVESQPGRGSTFTLRIPSA